MKKQIIISFVSLVTLLVISLVNASYYYEFNLNYNKGKIEINSINIKFSQKPISNFNPNNNYYIKIIDNKNNILEKVFFDVPNFFIVDFPKKEEKEFVELENVNFSVSASYYDNGYQAIVYDKNNNELNKEFVSQFSKVGFNKDDFIEDSRIGEIELGVKEKEEKFEERKLEKEIPYSNYILILTAILIILLIVFFYFMRRKK